MFWHKFEVLCRQIGKAPGTVAAELGFSNAATTAWKKGATPKNSTLKKIADYFGVSPEYFYTERQLSNISAIYVKASSEAAKYLEKLHQETGFDVEIKSMEELKATVAFIRAYRGQN